MKARLERWFPDLLAHGAPARPFLSTSLNIGSLSVLTIFAGLLKVKFTAVILGPDGIGLLAQGNLFLFLCITFATFGLGPSIIRTLTGYISTKDSENQQKLLSAAFSVQIVLSGLVIVFCLTLLMELTPLVFGPGQSVYYLPILLLSIPFTSLTTCYLRAYFFSHGRDALYSRASSAAIAIDVCIFTSLVYLYGILGAFIGIFCNSIILFSCFVVAIRRTRPAAVLFRWGLDRAMSRHLISTSSLILAVTAAVYTTNFMIRSHLVFTLGLEANGIYQVVVALTSYYSPLITAGLWAHFYPRVCEQGLSAKSFSQLRIITCLTATATAGVGLVLLLHPEGLVRLVYSKAFTQAADLLPYQLMGDFFFITAQPVLALLLGVSRLKTYAFIWMSYCAALYGLSVVFSSQLGISGFPLAYLFMNFVLLTVCLFIYRHNSPASSRLGVTFGVILFNGFFLAAQCATTLLHWGSVLRYAIPLLWIVVLGRTLWERDNRDILFA